MFLISGPCVIESEANVMQIAEHMKNVTDSLGIDYIFKASFDKANRSSTQSYRGPGIEEGLRILQKVKDDYGLRVLTDVHEDTPIDEVASVVDVMQTPAFLARQTNFIQKVAAAGLPVNVKKGQFQAPWDMQNVLNKCLEVGNKDIWLCDRGTSFGYNTLVSDMRGLKTMRDTGHKVVFDATHSVQQPGGNGTSSGGQREMVPVLARAATAVGVDGLFMETHPDPENALSDGPNMVQLHHMEELLTIIKEIDEITKRAGYLEDKMA